jgi:hypothetical protein
MELSEGTGVNSDHTKTTLFLTGFDVSLAESTRFELVHDC